MIKFFEWALFGVDTPLWIHTLALITFLLAIGTLLVLMMYSFLQFPMISIPIFLVLVTYVYYRAYQKYKEDTKNE